MDPEPDRLMAEGAPFGVAIARLLIRMALEDRNQDFSGFF